MVWGVMERDKEALSNKFGLAEYMSLGPGHVEGSSAGHNLFRKNIMCELTRVQLVSTQSSYSEPTQNSTAARGEA